MDSVRGSVGRNHAETMRLGPHEPIERSRHTIVIGCATPTDPVGIVAIAQGEPLGRNLAIRRQQQRAVGQQSLAANRMKRQHLCI